jgi:ABC-type antimicrobial peptide transport system permease subunit
MTAHAVGQRTREIGIRMALGARPRQVMALVLRQALLQVGAGLIAGAICTAIWGRLFGSNDMIAVGNLLGVAALLTVVAVGACLWPARRAARVDPVVALRQT